MSISCELPVNVITAFTSSHPDVLSPGSQLKSILLLLPVVLHVPTKLSPFISNVIILLSPTWSILKFDAEPFTSDDVV